MNIKQEMTDLFREKIEKFIPTPQEVDSNLDGSFVNIMCCPGTELDVPSVREEYITHWVAHVQEVYIKSLLRGEASGFVHWHITEDYRLIFEVIES